MAIFGGFPVQTVVNVRQRLVVLLPAAEAEPPATSDGHSGGTWLLLALFASMGGNIFLGYITWDIRKRFLAAFGENTTKSSNEPEPNEPHEVAGR